MSKGLEQQIEELEGRRNRIADQLKAKREKLRARKQSQERKRRTRRLILWGTVVEKMIEAGMMDRAQFRSACKRYLTKDRDLTAAEITERHEGSR